MIEKDVPVEELYLLSDKHIAYSQAISLKRIADALEKLAKPIIMPELTPEQEEEYLKAYQNHPGHIVRE